MNDMAANLKGVIPALAVSLTEQGRIDHELVRRQISYLVRGGIHGLFVNGTTGEGAILTTAEKLEILQLVKSSADVNIAVCAVSIQPSTEAALAEIRQFQDISPDFVAVTTPYYYALPQEAIIEHFVTIADASPIPLVLYNIPQNTHNAMTADTIARLASHPNIAGIKDSSGDFETFNQVVYSVGGARFTCLQGSDVLAAASFAAGAAGIVTGLGNARIEPYIDLHRAACADDRPGMKSAQMRIYAMTKIIDASGGKGISAIKAAMECQNRGRRSMKSPYMAVNDTEFDKIRSVIDGLD